MKVHIVSWAGVNHSYSIIAETYIKGLMMNSGLDFSFTEAVYHNKEWKRSNVSIFDKMKKPTEDEKFDITIRFVYPYNLKSDNNSKCTVVFMTSEFNYLSEFQDPYDVCDNVWIMTPSEYSKRCIVASGFNANKIFVIPHSYEYNDCPYTKIQLRDKYKIPRNNFVYFHNSSLTGNKNVSAIIEGFENVYKADTNVTLLIKGLDKTYNSNRKIDEIIQLLSLKTQITCIKNIMYIGADLEESQVVELYTVSDCYLSPFLAEGFNLPVLEALCHGLSIICTQGGPPDEFAKDAYFVDSKIQNTGEMVNVMGYEKAKTYLEPSQQKFNQLMGLVQIARKIYDKKKYRDAYSYKIIGKMLFDKLRNTLSKKYINPQIILLDSMNIDERIKNIRIFSGDVKIFVGQYNDVKYIQPQNNIVIIPLDRSVEQLCCSTVKLRDDNFAVTHCLSDVVKYSYKLKCVVDIMKKHSITEAVYLNHTIVVFADPRSIYKNECVNKNKYFYNIDCTDYDCMCVNLDKSTYIPNYLHMATKLEKDKHNFVVKHGNVRVLYVSNKETKHKVPMMINDNNSKLEDFYVEPIDTRITPEKLLGEVNISVITQNLLNKYGGIMKRAPLTVLFDENKMTSTAEDCKQFNVGKIFVYPEILEFFFKVIYPHINNKFTLYTLSCPYVINKGYETLDVNKKITECKYI